MTDHDLRERAGRRRFLAAAGALGAAGVAGCLDRFGGDGDDENESSVGEIGYGREGRDPPGGTPMDELPAIEGELTVYSGRGEALVGEFLGYIDDQYDDLDLQVRYGGSTELAGQIIEEGDTSPADVFYSVNAGALGALTDEGRTLALPEEVREPVREEFRTDHWVGTSGRARTVPHNTERLSADELPDDVMAYDDPDAVDAQLAWAPTYGSCQAFVTAMRLLEGEERTRQWLEGVVDRGIESYHDEFRVCQAIADGEVDAGFTNHYYIQRVLDGNPDAPLSTAFTENDAGAIFNVAGAATVDTAADADRAANFIRHLLSAEAQDYFARTTFEYPLIPEIDPIGDLPTIDELNPPADLDLTQLSEIEPTIDLMREAGVDV